VPFPCLAHQAIQIQHRLIFVNLPAFGFAFPRNAFALVEDQEREWPPATLAASALSQPFALHVRPSRPIHINSQFIRDRAGVSVLAVVDIERNRLVCPLGTDLVEAAAFVRVAGLLHADLETFGQEPERIEQRALADAILADHRCHGCQRIGVLQIPQFAQCHILQCTVIAHSQAFNNGHRMFLHFDHVYK